MGRSAITQLEGGLHLEAYETHASTTVSNPLGMKMLVL